MRKFFYQTVPWRNAEKLFEVCVQKLLIEHFTVSVIPEYIWAAVVKKYSEVVGIKTKMLRYKLLKIDVVQHSALRLKESKEQKQLQK